MKDVTLIHQEARGQTAGYDFPQLAIHRGKLQSIIYDTFVKRIGLEKLHFDYCVLSYQERKQGITALFEKTEGTADVLIGADGIYCPVLIKNQ